MQFVPKLPIVPGFFVMMVLLMASLPEKETILSLASVKTIMYDEIVGLLRRNCGDRLDTCRGVIRIAVV